MRVGSGDGSNTVLGGHDHCRPRPREIALTIDQRDRTARLRPEVRTGDAAFDQRFLVQGWPEDSCRAALSPAVRSWITAGWPSGWPQIEAEDGELWVDATVFPRSGPWATAAEFQAMMARTVELASGLVAGYDQARAAVVEAGGEQAGLTWEAELRAHRATRGRTRLLFRLLAFVIFSTLVLVVAGIVAFATGLL